MGIVDWFYSLTPKEFMNILITIFIAMFFVVFWQWRIDLQDCTDRCIACIQLREWSSKIGFNGTKDVSYLGYSTSIWVEINVSRETREILECTYMNRFNLSEWERCNRLVHL